jgi:hypothetical protein
MIRKSAGLKKKKKKKKVMVHVSQVNVCIGRMLPSRCYLRTILGTLSGDV